MCVCVCVCVRVHKLRAGAFAHAWVRTGYLLKAAFFMHAANSISINHKSVYLTASQKNKPLCANKFL